MAPNRGGSAKHVDAGDEEPYAGDLDVVVDSDMAKVPATADGPYACMKDSWVSDRLDYGVCAEPTGQS